MGACGRGRGQQPSVRAPSSGTLSSPFGSLVTLYPDARTRSHTHTHAHASTLNCTRARSSPVSPPKATNGLRSSTNTEESTWQLSYHFPSFFLFPVRPVYLTSSLGSTRNTRGMARTHAHGKAQVRGIKCDSGRASEYIPGKTQGYTRATSNLNLDLRSHRSCVGAATHTRTRTPPHTSLNKCV